MFGDKPKNQNLMPYIKRMNFGNFSAEGLERGDILYFGYTSANRDDEIINPLIVFAGYDATNNLIYGPNLRMFYLEKQTSIGTAFLRSFEKVYWDLKPNVKTNQLTKEKRKISYNSPNAFTYENLNMYNMVNIRKVVNGQIKNVNLLREYWRGYTPKNMKIIMDNFLKVSNGNISLNIDAANVIINVAPKHVSMQKQLPDEGV
jgi:hypothetical protein